MDWRCLFQKSVFGSCSIEAEWIIEQSQSGVIAVAYICS
jgi:hypothetical protein